MSIQPGHIAILGAGESGVGTAILALKMGWKVFVSDKGEVKQEFQDKRLASSPHLFSPNIDLKI